MKYLAWFPVGGIFVEVSSRDNYLSDPEHAARFYLSAIWHGLWIVALVVMLVR